MKFRPRRSPIAGRGWLCVLVVLLLLVAGLSYVRILQWMHVHAGRVHQSSRSGYTRRFSSQSEYDKLYQRPSAKSTAVENRDKMQPLMSKSSSPHVLEGDKTGPSLSSPAPVDVHLFVIWHGAMTHKDEILLDIAKRFAVLDVKYFDWTSEVDTAGRRHDPRRLLSSSLDASAKKGAKPSSVNVTALEEDYFLMNLWRLYNGKGGATKQNMPLKVRQCGRGPFIVAVVVDESPLYQDESTAHGIDHVNHHMNEAKAQYRRWSGGGFRVHGTFNALEAAHDVTLLFHKHPDEYAAEYLGRVVASSSPAGDDEGGQRRSISSLSRRSSEAAIRPFLGKAKTLFAPSLFGPDGTLGYHDDALSSGWPNCSAFFDVILRPWTAADRKQMVTDGFYEWDREAAYPGAPLNPEECERWSSTEEWVLVVPESAWWSMASLLNARWGELAAGVLNDGKPDVIPVRIAGVVNRIHLRGYASSSVAE